MRDPWVLRVALALCACAVLGAGLPAFALEMPFVEVQACGDEDEGPFYAEADNNFFLLPDSEGHALGDLTNPAAGLAKAVCWLTGHDPYMGNWLSVGADVTTEKPFKVESETLADGTPVSVDLQVRYDGSLQAYENNMIVGPLEEFTSAYASCLVEIEAAGGAVLASAEGEAEVRSYYVGENGGGYEYFATALNGDGGFVTEAEDWGAWDGLLVADPGAGRDELRYLLDYSNTLTFDAVVGGEYVLYFDLATGVKTSDGYDSGVHGASDAFAQADFWNTGSYQLTATQAGTDISFKMAPEPATMALLGLGALALVRRRRRSA